MKILYDNQIFSDQKFGGISRYFYELIKNLDEDVDYSLPIIFSNNFYLQKKEICKQIQLFPNNKIPGRNLLIKKVNRLVMKSAFRDNYSIFHPTYYDPYFLKYLKGHPFILTIHDMTHEKFSFSYAKNDYSAAGKKILAKEATKIIAVSENTKKDVIDILGIDEDKIEVIYHGCNLSPASESTLRLPEKFVLYIGDRGCYKNFTRFVSAFALLLDKDPDLKLICTGRPFSRTEQTLLSELKITPNIYYYSVNDKQLAELYSSALLFVFPSEYEGFGIPILEAFICGCPVALSNSSCFPEIAGNAGEYFNPLDIESMAEAMKSVIYDSNRRTDLIEKGKERLKMFSWKKTAIETCRLYKSLL